MDPGGRSRWTEAHVLDACPQPAPVVDLSVSQPFFISGLQMALEWVRLTANGFVVAHEKVWKGVCAGYLNRVTNRDCWSG